MQFSIYQRTISGKDPDALLRLFVVVALVSGVVITSLAGYTFNEVLHRYIISSAEDDAISVSSALLSMERDHLTVLGSDGSSRVEVSPADMPRLDQQLRTFLSPFGIVKIKIYSSDYRIVYSTETRLIGEVNRGNKRLAHALAGAFDSKLERKEEVKDLADELKFNVDVVETYIPIRSRDNKVIGSFEVYIDVSRYHHQAEKAAALSIGILIAILLIVFGISYILIRRGTRDLKEMQEVLRRQTITDPLTGAFNKRQIELISRKEFSRTMRRREKGMPDGDMSFIMIDIDRFKEVNDNYGHLAGDVLLQAFAERVSSSLRSYDSIGRFGGEEFLIVLPGTNLEQARAAGLKIWSLIREESFPVDGERIAVTASIGIAAMEEGDAEYQQVLKRADQKLYSAKSSGRDRIC